MNNEFFENAVKIGALSKRYSFMCSKNGANSRCHFVAFVWRNKTRRTVEVEFDGFPINSFFTFIDFVFLWYSLKKFYLIVCPNKWNNWHLYMLPTFKPKWRGFKPAIIVSWFLVTKLVETISNVTAEKTNKLFSYKHFKRVSSLIQFR